MLKINIITVFPELIESHFNFLPFKKALEKNLIDVNLINLRDYAVDERGSVDDKPYGGGVGMLLRIEPIYNALQSLNLKQDPHSKIVLLSPSGKKYTQKIAKEYSVSKEITIICGRYEGVDARVKNFVTDTISIGDYVLSGGELPALIILESITRLLPGVLEKEVATLEESFSFENTIEYPQYTRPEEFKGLKVPEVLLSGNHKKIEEWKNNQKIGSSSGSSSVNGSAGSSSTVSSESGSTTTDVS